MSVECKVFLLICLCIGFAHLARYTANFVYWIVVVISNKYYDARQDKFTTTENPHKPPKQRRR